MPAPALTSVTNSLISVCAETSTNLEPELARHRSSPAKPLYTRVRAMQTALKQLQEALDQVLPTAIHEHIHVELLNVLQSAGDWLLAAKHVAAKFKSVEKKGPLERAWRTFKLGGLTAQTEIQRTGKALESALTAIGLGVTLVKRFDRPQAREGLLILLRSQERPKSQFVMSSVVPVSSSCMSPLDFDAFLAYGF